MSTEYSTIQQHQPLRVPTGWSTQERALIVQLDELFDDLYSRFNRLKLKDFSKDVQSVISESAAGIAELHVEVNGISTRVTTAEGDISSLEQTAAGLTTTVQSHTGSISSLNQTATSLTTRVTSAEGDISTLEQTAAGLTTTVQSHTGSISTLTQTTEGLSTTVQSHTGSISSLNQTATSLNTRVGTAEGNISTLNQTATTLSAQVADKYGKVSGISIELAGIDITGNQYIRMGSGGTTNLELSKNGIDMSTAGTFRVKADNTKGSIIFGQTAQDANFSVNDAGSLRAKTATFDSLTVNGITLQNIILSDNQPSGHGIIWVKPSSSTEKNFSHNIVSGSSEAQLDVTGGSLGYYKDISVSYAAADYLAGNLYYGFTGRLLVWRLPSVRTVTFRARLISGSTNILIGEGSAYIYSEYTYVPIDSLLTSLNANVLNPQGGSLTLRLETSCPSGYCRMEYAEVIVKAKTTGASGVSACSVFYIN